MFPSIFKKGFHIVCLLFGISPTLMLSLYWVYQCVHTSRPQSTSLLQMSFLWPVLPENSEVPAGIENAESFTPTASTEESQNFSHPHKAATGCGREAAVLADSVGAGLCVTAAATPAGFPSEPASLSPATCSVPRLYDYQGEKKWMMENYI